VIGRALAWVRDLASDLLSCFIFDIDERWDK
jgi:hypothetical protein